MNNTDLSKLGAKEHNNHEQKTGKANFHLAGFVKELSP